MTAAGIVAIIDDDESFRRSLALLIKSRNYQAIEFACAEDFIAAPARESIDCAIVDVRMPGIDGLDLQQHSSRTHPHIAIIFLTGQAEVPDSVRAMKDGAVDFLQKPVREELLFPALSVAMELSRRLRAAALELEGLKKRYSALTPREREVFALVATGLLNKQIAIKLGTAECTVKAHRRQVMNKLKADSLAHLVRIADQLVIERISKGEWNELSGRRSLPA